MADSEMVSGAVLGAPVSVGVVVVQESPWHTCSGFTVFSRHDSPSVQATSVAGNVTVTKVVISGSSDD